MASRFILTISSLTLFLSGWALTLAPAEMATWLGASRSSETALALQLFGSALLGFAILDWMSRGNRIGGIYARPIALGNLLLFIGVSLALGRAAAAGTGLPPSAYASGVSCLFALAFMWLAFIHDPVPR